MSMGIFGSIEIIGILNFPGISTGLALDSFVFTIPRIVLIVGREDEFSPPVEDIKLIVFDKVWSGEDGFKVIVNTVFASGEGVRDVESHDFTLQVLLKGSIDASVGVNGHEHNVVISDGLGRIGVSWINLRRLGSITKLPEVLITAAIGVVNELDLSGEEINLFCSGIEGSDRSRHNTDGGVYGI
jgi:hypothetical protein